MDKQELNNLKKMTETPEFKTVALTIKQLSSIIDLALKGLDEWEPIETAPKDGTPVILYDPEKRFGTDVLEGYYDDGLWLIQDRGVVNATHWKSLPTPPKEGHQP